MTSTFSFLFSISVLFSFAFGAQAAPIDPLSRGPLPLTAKNIQDARNAFRDGLIYTDAECYLKPEEIAATEIPIQNLASDVCNGRTRELLYLASKSAIIACSNGKPDFAMLVSIGSNGIGKTTEGNRKSPLGTYWVGHPRRSQLFGIFIPIGYPNMSNIARGYTGNSVGIHGPMRFMTCLPQKSLEKNWTAGCFAFGRDSQTIALSEWIFANWPTKLTISKD